MAGLRASMEKMIQDELINRKREKPLVDVDNFSAAQTWEGTDKALIDFKRETSLDTSDPDELHYIRFLLLRVLPYLLEVAMFTLTKDGKTILCITREVEENVPYWNLARSMRARELLNSELLNMCSPEGTVLKLFNKQHGFLFSMINGKDTYNVMGYHPEQVEPVHLAIPKDHTYWSVIHQLNIIPGVIRVVFHTPACKEEYVRLGSCGNESEKYIRDNTPSIDFLRVELAKTWGGECEWSVEFHNTYFGYESTPVIRFSSNDK
jgi:hypothetical protein